MGKEYKIAVIITAKDKAGAALGGLGKTLGGLGKVAAVGLAGIAAGAAAAGAGLAKLALDAAPLAGIQAAFEGVAASFEGGSEVMLNALQAASAGMVSNEDLMLSFNRAAMLVSKNFARDLPDAMKYLSKVSAATGTSMDYMMNSLVTGVGRLSPMILDNLGIQVSLTEAYEVYAKSIRKTVGELNKEEQQTAVMNQVLAKLAERTAAMPEVTGSATAGMAAFGTQLKNAKDQIGLALQPALADVLGLLSELADQALPPLVEGFQNLVDVVGPQLSRGIEIISALMRGDFTNALYTAGAIVQDAFGHEAAMGFINFVKKIQEGAGEIPGILDKVGEVIGKVVTYFKEAWPEIQATIGKVGEVIGKLAGYFEEAWPKIQAAVLTAWEVIQAVGGAIITVFLEQVWPAIQEAGQSILGIFETLGIGWEDIKNALIVGAQAIGAVILAAVAIIVGIATAIGKVAAHIANTLAAIVETFKKGFESVVRILVGVWEIIVGIFTGNSEKIKAGIQALIQGIRGFWEAFFQGIINLFNLSFGTIITAVSGFIEGVIGFFQDLYNRLVGESVIPEMLAAVWQSFCDIIGDILEFLGEQVESFLTRGKELVQGIIDGIGEMLSDFIGLGRDIIQGLITGMSDMAKALLDYVRELISSLISVILEKFGMESPSRVMRAIGHNLMAGLALGIADAAGLPQLALDMALRPLAGLGAGALGGGGGVSNAYDNRTWGGDTINANVYDSGAGAMLLAMIEERRRARLNAFMGV